MAHEYVHDPDECFACKCQYWRTNGGLSVRIPAGWGGPSLKAQAEKIVEDNKASGGQPEHVGNRWV